MNIKDYMWIAKKITIYLLAILLIIAVLIMSPFVFLAAFLFLFFLCLSAGIIFGLIILQRSI